MRLEYIARYEGFIFVGLLMVLGTALKLLGKYDFSSDWFWLIAGIGLVIEGTISYVKQSKFDSKFKILKREEYEKLTGKND
ncbi:MAG: hypothetical protein AABX28_02270 [Nanoarchaeota archaeon]